MCTGEVGMCTVGKVRPAVCCASSSLNTVVSSAALFHVCSITAGPAPTCCKCAHKGTSAARDGHSAQQ
jgi:hypothetical protein